MKQTILLNKPIKKITFESNNQFNISLINDELEIINFFNPNIADKNFEILEERIIKLEKIIQTK